MKKTEIVHGGARKNAGRKPLSPEKRRTTLQIFPEQGVVDAIGGMEKAKEIAFAAIERAYSKIIFEKD